MLFVQFMSVRGKVQAHRKQTLCCTGSKLVISRFHDLVHAWLLLARKPENKLKRTMLQLACSLTLSINEISPKNSVYNSIFDFC